MFSSVQLYFRAYIQLRFKHAVLGTHLRGCTLQGLNIRILLVCLLLLLLLFCFVFLQNLRITLYMSVSKRNWLVDVYHLTSIPVLCSQTKAIRRLYYLNEINCLAHTLQLKAPIESPLCSPIQGDCNCCEKNASLFKFLADSLTC